MIKLFHHTNLRLRFNHYLDNEFLKKFTTVLGVDILVKASAFILLPVFLRLMSQEEFGLYNYLLSIIQTFSLVLNLGLYIPQTKLYHSYESKEEKGQLVFTISSTLLVFLIFFSLMFNILGLDYKIVRFLFGSHLDYNDYRGLVLLSLLVTVFSFMLTNFFYTSEKIKQVRSYNIYRVLVINIVSLLALFFINADAVRVRIGATYISELGLFLIFGYYLVREAVPRFRKEMMWKSIRMGFPIMVSAVFGIVVNFSDKFLLQKYGSLKDLSNYYLAFSFAGIIPLVFASLQNVWLPVFMKEKDVERNFQKTRRMIVNLCLAFLVLAVFIWLLFELLLILSVIPAKYSSVSWILPILLAAQIFAAVTSLFSNYLIYFEKTGIASLTGLLVSVISIVLGLWLVPLWGVLGAAVTTFAINLVYMVIYYFLLLYFKKQYLPGTSRIIKTVS
jgi:O-antigen/teichoic acid export membrane protein